MISSSLAYFLLLGSLAFFAWLGYKESLKIEIDQDSFQSARNSQNWIMIGLSLFASGIGIWILFGPSSVPQINLSASISVSVNVTGGKAMLDPPQP